MSPKDFSDQLLNRGSEDSLHEAPEYNGLNSGIHFSEELATKKYTNKKEKDLEIGYKKNNTKNSKEARQKQSILWPCVDLVVGIYTDCTIDIHKFTALNPEQRHAVILHLKSILSPNRFDCTKDYLCGALLNKRNSILLKNTDFATCNKRQDESLKLVISQALKWLLKNFTKANHINQTTDPNKFVHREAINKLIYKKYFCKDPQSDEHMLLFDIQKGINFEWFWIATGGVKMRVDFILDLLQILEDSSFFEFYKEKIESMIRRILGLVEFADNPTTEESRSDEIEKVLIKLRSKKDVKKHKIPCNKLLFQSCVKFTVNKLLEFADQRSLKIIQPK